MNTTLRVLLQLLSVFIISNPMLGQWVQTNGTYGDYVSSFAVSGINLFVGMQNGGVFHSTDNGASWTAVNSGLPSADISSLVVSDTNIFAGTHVWTSGFPEPGAVFRSTNNGASWTMTGGIDYGPILCFAIKPNGAIGKKLFAGAAAVSFEPQGHILLSADNGTTWTSVFSSNVSSIVVNGTNLFAGGDGVFRSTDDGASWTAVNSGLLDTSVTCLLVSGTNLFAGTHSGVFRSTNNGASWTPVSNGLTNFWISSLAVSGEYLFAGTWRGICLSTDNGTSWESVNLGLPDTLITSITVSGTKVFAGTPGGRVWRRSVSEMVTSVGRVTAGVPTCSSLDQNYPNPFNPSTEIQFSLARRSYVTLTIFDLIGREVATLVSEELQAGTYRTRWDAAGFPSGVYFYRLQTDGFVKTKKLLLLR